jgi:dipeptidyl aminopeptidase/acylaminoacyl peptidase
MGTLERDYFGMQAGDQRVALYLDLELLASRGYAVFVPNSVLRLGHPMRDIADEILPGIDKIVAMGVADPARLGVYGQSYGGYSTFSLIVQTTRFKVAIAMDGMSDLVSQYGFLHDDGSDWTGGLESEWGRMGGTPWQYRDRYIENSPLFYLDRVQTPVLIEFGGDDQTVGPYQSREAFVGLRRLGRIATLVGYPKDGHALVTTAHQLDFWQRMLDWLNTYLPSGNSR